MVSLVFTSALSVLSPASAAELRTIAVVGIHQPNLDPAAQREAIAKLVEAIEATGRFDGVPAAEVRTGIQGRESVILEEGLLSGPREELTLGRTAYNKAAWGEAIEHLTEAIAGFRAMFQGANQAEDLWDAYVYLGSSHLLADKPNEAEARVAFAAAVALSPAKPMNSALFPPNVVSVHEAVRKELLATKAKLEVSAGPGSSVWLDGIERGPSPLTIADVVSGEHHLVARSAESDGYLRFTLGKSPAPRVEIPMGNPTFGAPATSPIGRSAQVAALYQSLAARSGGLDYILIVGTVDSALALQLFDTRSRTYGKPLEVPYVDSAVDEALQAIPLLLNGVAPDGSFVTPAAAPPPVDVAANGALALLLTERIAAQPFSGAPAFPGAARKPLDDPKAPKDGKKVKAGVVLGVVAGVLVVGGASAGGYYLLSSGAGDPNQGSVIIEF